mmetsp:Transcript_10892/g.30677  ORF Transcript_10892/g.30677 Transcript_10892/m.30677 type:complete len:232 (+) Transcript_10892:715-1410(+)
MRVVVVLLTRLSYCLRCLPGLAKAGADRPQPPHLALLYHCRWAVCRSRGWSRVAEHLEQYRHLVCRCQVEEGRDATELGTCHPASSIVINDLQQGFSIEIGPKLLLFRPASPRASGGRGQSRCVIAAGGSLLWPRARRRCLLQPRALRQRSAEACEHVRHAGVDVGERDRSVPIAVEGLPKRAHILRVAQLTAPLRQLWERQLAVATGVQQAAPGARKVPAALQQQLPEGC